MTTRPILTKVRHIPFFVGGALLLLAPRLEAQICVQPTSSHAEQVAELASILSSNNSKAASLRSRIGVSTSDSTTMAVVTNDSICARVDSALMRKAVPPTFSKLIVYRLNASRYAAFDQSPSQTALFFIDDSWQVQTAVGGRTISSAPSSNASSTGTPGAALSRSLWTLSASSTWAYAPLNEAIDASLGSKWSAGAVVSPGVTYFAIDMHASQTIGALRVNNSQFATETPLAGNVLVSGDGTSYTQVAQWTTSNIVGGLLEVIWSPVSTRYVKLVATQVPSVSTNGFSIADARLYASLPEIVMTGTASGSSYYDPPKNAFDGNAGTRWASGGSVTPNATYFLVDLHTTASMGSMTLNSVGFSGDIPTTGDILISNNGATFARVAQWTSANMSSGVLTKAWTSQPARYIKLVATSTPSSSGNWWSIGELTFAP